MFSGTGQDTEPSPVLPGTAVLPLPAFPIYNNNSKRNQSQRKEAVPREGLFVFAQKKSGENHAHHRIDKAEDRNPAHRVVLEQEAPEGIGTGGQETHVEQVRDAGRAVKGQLSSGGDSDQKEYDSSENELVSAQDDRVFIFRIDFDQAAGDRIEHRREKHGPVAGKGKGSSFEKGTASAEDDQDPEKSDKASGQFSDRQLFQTEYARRKTDREKVVGGIDDSSPYACCFGQRQEEEIILADGLNQTKDKDIFQGLSLRKKQPARRDRSEQHRHQPGQCKACAGQHDTGAGVAGINLKQIVGDLDGGYGAPPEHAAEYGGHHNNRIISPDDLLFRS